MAEEVSEVVNGKLATSVEDSGGEGQITDLDELLNDALDDFEQVVKPAHRHEGPQNARDANVASTNSQDHPAAKSNSFDPLPSRGNKSKARGRKQLDSLPESAPPLSSLEDAAGPNLKAILDELATAGATWQTEAAASEYADTGSRTRQPMFGGLQGENEQNNELDSAGLGGLADSLMHHLLSKDVLYQPMKDIGERYPAWLAAHRDTLSKKDIDRYEEQLRQIQKILAIYEESPDDYIQLFSALQQMQSCGQPPVDIVNDFAPGLSYDESGVQGNMQSGLPSCCIQ